jgi:secreted Zn-dependent insulinase-like peptidase
LGQATFKLCAFVVAFCVQARCEQRVFGTLQLKLQPAALGIDLRSQLLRFHDQWYSAHLMKLCVLGRQPLDELEAWVREKFGAVTRNSTNPPVFDPLRYDTEQLGTIL